MFDAPENQPADQPVNQPATAATNRAEVEPLRFMMHMQQESRAKVLAEIRQKVSDGHYLTRQSAEESAARLLNDGEFIAE